MRIQRLMKLHRLMDQAGEGGSDAGGTGTGDAAIAAEAAARAAADAANAAVIEAVKGNKPTEAEAKLLKDLMKHKTRAAELETQLSQANEKVKGFEGVDLEKARVALAEQEELERKRLEAAGDYERLTKQMGERHTSEKTALQQQVEDSRRAAATLQMQIADLTVGNSFVGSKFVQEDLTLTPSKARVIYGAHFEFKDGKVVGFDKPAGASERTVLVNSTGEPLGFEDALRKIVDADPDKDQLIRSKMKPGAGSNTATKGAKLIESERKTQLSSVERIAAGLKNLANQNKGS